MLNAIFFVTMYPVIFLMYFIQKADGNYKRHTLFGIRVSKDWISDEECKALSAEYQREMKRNLITWGLIPFITLIIPYFSINITIWLIWMFAAIIAFMLPYAKGYHKLLAWKQERNPASAKNNISYTEIKGSGTIRTIKKTDFLLPLLVNIILAVLALFFLNGERYEMYNIVIVAFAACSPLLQLCAIATDKIKTKVISSDSDVNVNFARANKRIWKGFWGYAIWVTTLFTAILFAMVYLTSFTNTFAIRFIILGSILHCLLLLIGAVWALNQKNKLEKQYEDKMDIVDDNEETGWIGGILYYNPRDTHTMVSKKHGSGTTVNLATPVGKANIIFIGLMLLFLPICCIWVMLEEFTPISLSVENNVLTAEHWKEEYTIPTLVIDNLTLVEEVPRSTKINGTGMDHLKKGTFRNSADGKVEYFLNPKNNVFLRFTSGETIYYMSGFDDEETMQIYELINRK